MKKIIAAAVLAGCTIFGANANAGDFTLGLPGFVLNITDGFRKEVRPAPPHREFEHHRFDPGHHAPKFKRDHHGKGKPGPALPPKRNGRHR